MFPEFAFYSGELSRPDITEGFLGVPYLGDRLKIIEFFTHALPHRQGGLSQNTIHNFLDLG